MTESTEVDEALLVKIGLDTAGFYGDQGSTCSANFDEILTLFRSETVNTITKSKMVETFKMWGLVADPTVKLNLLTTQCNVIYDLVAYFATIDADAPVEGVPDSDHKGNCFIAHMLTELLSTFGMMDQTQSAMKAFAPFAYRAAETILDSNARLVAKPMMQSYESGDNKRVEIIKTLIRTLPFQGTDIPIPNGVKVLARIITSQTIPANLKADAKSAFQTLSQIAKQIVSQSGSEIVAIAKMPGNEQLFMLFVTLPELYSNSTDAVHKNLSSFMKLDYMMYSSLFMNIARLHPQELVTCIDFFVSKLVTNVNVGTVTLMVLESLATHSPESVFPFIDQIAARSSSIQSGNVFFSRVLGHTAKATEPANAADICFAKLVDILSGPNAAGATATAVLTIISNIMSTLSARQLLLDSLPALAAFRESNEASFILIDDFANERSLEQLTKKVEELDKKINALNSKVSETCQNMSDVIAYVDANMADMKDFLAEVVKKLPTPKRLQIDGRLRKSLILVFECCDTGLEYGIVTTEWSKWLKMGFSMVKAGTSILELGIGNPIGVLMKGVNCVQEIYSYYQENDDDEFNTYITQPFLTSSEQDKLIEKLRDQHFFEKFGYNAQKHGWYLLNPEVDGQTQFDNNTIPGLTGVLTGLLSAATDLLPVSDDVKSLINTVGEAAVSAAVDAATVSDDPKKMKSSKDATKSDVAPVAATNSNKPSGGGAPGPVGSRAAAMREGFGSSVTAAADTKLVQTNNTVAVNSRLSEMEEKIASLEKKIQALENAPRQAATPQSCCVIA